MLDPRERFSATAELYQRHRPGYPAALFEWIEETTGVRPPGPVADIGCGTGISTRLLAERGYDVVGVDPNEEMLERARRAPADERAGSVRYQRGDASATGLAGASARLVTAAQAFHWFAVEPTLVEWRRILVPGGWACAFWNVRAPSPFNDDYEALLVASSAEYRAIPKPDETLAALRAAIPAERRCEARFPSAQSLDREGLMGRVHSSSYVAHGVDDRARFDAALADLFARHARDGRVTMGYDTVALAWRG